MHRVVEGQIHSPIRSWIEQEESMESTESMLIVTREGQKEVTHGKEKKEKEAHNISIIHGNGWEDDAEMSAGAQETLNSILACSTRFKKHSFTPA